MQAKHVVFFMIIGLLACHPTQDMSIQDEGRKVKAKPIGHGDVEQTLFIGKMANDPEVKTGKLPNGLTYYIKKNGKPENRAELRLVVKAGSINEDADQLGLAHFVEHMAFNGTENFKKNELIDYLESVGSQFGPDLNAYTSFDETVYMLQVRTDQEDQLKKGLLVLSDWASGLTFDPEEVDKERGVVISEWRSRLSPNQRMSNEYLPVMLKGSRYANRLPIGDPENIENADVETIKRFYYNWYRPDLMAVVLVGDFNVALMEDFVHSYFSTTPKAINPRKRKSYDIPGHDSTLVKVCSDPEAPFTQVQIINKINSDKLWSVEQFIERMGASLTADMWASRLQDLTREEDAKLMYAFANYGRLFGPADAFTVFGVTPEGQSLVGLEKMMIELYRAKQHGFTQTELDRAKEKMKKEAEVLLNEKDKTESKELAGQLINHFLTGKPYPSVENYHYLLNKYIGSIQLEDLNDEIERWTQDANRVVIVTGPEKEGLDQPKTSEIMKLLHKLSQSEFAPYVDDVQEGPLLDLGRSELYILKKDTVQVNSIEKWTLSNGAQLYFKNTDYNNDEILFHATASGGTSVFEDDKYLQASLSSQLIDESGLGNFSASDLKKKLAGSNVQVYSYVSDYDHGIRGRSSVSDAEPLSDLLYMSFSQLREDEAAFEALKSKMKAIYGNINSDPGYYFRNKSQELLYDGHPRKRVPQTEDIDQLDGDQMRAAFRRLFSSPSAFNFVFVGNLDDETKKVLATRIGQIKNSETDLSKYDRGERMIGSGIERWSKGSAPKTYVQLVYQKPYTSSSQDRMLLSALRDVLNIKLRESLREDEGGVYGVSTRMNMTSFPETNAILTIQFNAEPKRADELIEVAQGVISQMVEEGLDAEVIQKVVESKRQQYVKGFRQNGFWLSQMVYRLQQEEGLDEITMEEKERLLKAIDAETIHELARSYFANNTAIQLVQEPE